VVTQEALARYAAPAAEVRGLRGRQQRLREALLGALGRGARVEAGPYSARVTRRAQKALSRERLGRVLGEAGLERVLRLLEPTERVYLHVVKAEGPVDRG
jgi:hypothetical protein